MIVCEGLPDALGEDVDLILANLPYVTDATISERSPEIRREPGSRLPAPAERTGWA